MKKVSTLSFAILSLTLSLIFTSLSFSSRAQSVAQDWNEIVLEGIRNDFARPTVHARNLWHSSVLMYDCWAAYEPNAETFFLGKDIGGYPCAFEGIEALGDKKAAQEEAMSYAMYRLIKYRFANSPDAVLTFALADSLFAAEGYDPAYTSINYESDSAAALGNYLAANIIAFGQQDGSNELNDYENLYYEPVNPPMPPVIPGNVNIVDLNRWQPLQFNVFIDQSGNVIGGATPDFLGPEWGNVVPFAMTDTLVENLIRDGENWQVWQDPGPPPYNDIDDAFGTNEYYQWGFSLVSVWSSHLDPEDTTMWDISPASIGNVAELPANIADYPDFYNLLEGGDPSLGHTMNPKTGAPYTPQMVKRADYARVLAEFWADGPDSETPPGHWFTLLNYVMDHPDFQCRWRGEGPLVDPLEYAVKAYLTMGGGMHDAAIAAWSVKGYYDYIRPVSAIRAMADLGQSTDTTLENYHSMGIPLIPGYIEIVEVGDPLAGFLLQNVGKIKLLAWAGPDYITNPDIDVAGVRWILAEKWWPYQRPTFVTPPFAGYVSGHSTYSRAAAEIMTLITGDEYFPGGMGEFEAPMNEFLVFEDGPSTDLTLQWATYRDASDQCSLSRIWGGIHPPADDIPGRKMGIEIGPRAYDYAQTFFDGNGMPDVVSVTASPELVTNSEVGTASFSLSIVYEEDMNTGISPVISFPFEDPSATLSFNADSSGWLNDYTYIAKYDVADVDEEIDNIDIQINAAANPDGTMQADYTGVDVFSIDTKHLIHTTWEENVGLSSATLHWNEVEGSCKYVVRGRLEGGSTFFYLVVNGVSNNSKIISNLDPGTTYEWQVSPYCSATGIDTTGNWSELDAFTTLECNSPVAISTTNISTGSATLNWSPVPGAIAYKIQGGMMAGSLSSIITASTSFNVQNLNDNTTYMWRVLTNCGSEIVDTSSFNNFTTLVCETPVGLTISDITASSATLSWTEIPGVFGYQLLGGAGIEPGTSYNLTGSANNSFTASNLKPGKTYTWGVYSVCDASPINQSELSAIYSFTTLTEEASARLIDPENGGIADGQGIMQISPNPGNGVFKVDLQGSKASEAFIYDLQGRLILQRYVNSSSDLEFELDQLMRGTYLVKLVADDGVYVDRVVVQ